VGSARTHHACGRRAKPCAPTIRRPKLQLHAPNGQSWSSTAASTRGSSTNGGPTARAYRRPHEGATTAARNSALASRGSRIHNRLTRRETETACGQPIDTKSSMASVGSSSSATAVTTNLFKGYCALVVVEKDGIASDGDAPLSLDEVGGITRSGLSRRCRPRRPLRTGFHPEPHPRVVTLDMQKGRAGDLGHL